MERREFLGWVGAGALASSLPVAIAACTPNQTSQTPEDEPDEPATATPDAEGFLTLGTVEAMAQNGYLANEAYKVIVVRQPDGSLSALNAVCPHRQCLVAWKSDSTSLVCPCHSSEFATDGSVIAGPATAPLPAYEVKEDGTTIAVKVG